MGGGGETGIKRQLRHEELHKFAPFTAYYKAQRQECFSERRETMWVRVEVRLLSFLTSVIGVNGQLHISATQPPEKRVPGAHGIATWLVPSASLGRF